MRRSSKDSANKNLQNGFSCINKYDPQTMLNIGCVHLIASDVHGLKKRPILLKDAYDFVTSHHSEDIAEILFYENPKRILHNEPLIHNFEGYFDERKKPGSLKNKLKSIFKL